MGTNELRICQIRRRHLDAGNVLAFSAVAEGFAKLSSEFVCGVERKLGYKRVRMGNKWVINVLEWLINRLEWVTDG